MSLPAPPNYITFTPRPIGDLPVEPPLSRFSLAADVAIVGVAVALALGILYAVFLP